MLEIRLFGQFSIQRDRQSVEVPSRPAQSLLAYLVLNAPRKQPRERLAGLFWPDADDDAARQNLRNALWRLRSALGDAHLTADKLVIGLAETSGWWSDATCLHDVDDAKASDEDLARALEGYAGELLPGFYDEWVSLERERLAAAFERKIQVLVARHEAAGRWPEVLDWSERWLARAGASEPAYRALMRAHAGLGDRPGVGAAYRRCVAALEEELGMPPSDATIELYERLLQDGEPTPPARTSAPAQGPAFLGDDGRRRTPAPRPAAREQELTALLDAVDAAVAGTGRVVLLTGEAGEGKSTLLAALSELASERHPELVVARGACDAFAGEGRAFGPFSEAFRWLTGDVEAAWTAGLLPGDHARRLWALVPHAVGAVLERARPLVGTLIDGPALARHAASFAMRAPIDRLAELTAMIGAAEASNPRLEQAALFDAAAEFLLTLSRARPIVLLLDDLHWMDASSAGLLLHLSRRLAGTRLVVVGAFRPEEAASSAQARLPLADVLGELQRVVGKVTLTLGGRGEQDARAFVDALLDREPNTFDQAFRATLARQTRGHALFTVELIDDLKARGAIVQDEAGRWAMRADLAPGGLPARIEGVLQSRLGRLDDALRRALTIGAVEGEEFTAEVVARVAGADAWRLLERLASEAGRHHRLVDELGTLRVGGRRLSRFRFRHNLFQRFLYEELGPSMRPRLHEAVAEALVEAYGADAGAIAIELGRHFLAAELPDRALPHLLEAGRAANRLAAHHEAQGQLEAALSALDHVPPGPERDAFELDIRLELTVALHVTEGFAAPAIAAHAGRAIALAEAAGDADRHFRALWSLWLHHVACFDVAGSQAVSRALLAAAGDDPDRRLQAHHAAWSDCHLVGDFRAGRHHLAAGAGLYDEARHDHLIGAYAGHDPGVCRLCYQARMDLNDGAFGQALARIEEAIALATRLGHAYGVSQAMTVKAEVLFRRGDFHGTIAATEAAIAHADANGMPFWRSYAVLGRGRAQAALGMPEGLEAIRAFQPGKTAVSPTLRAYEAAACLALGRLDEGLAAVSAALSEVERTGEAAMHAELYLLRAALLQRTTPADQAGVEEALDQAAATADVLSNPVVGYQAAEALCRLWTGTPREAEGLARVGEARSALPEAPPQSAIAPSGAWAGAPRAGD